MALAKQQGEEGIPDVFQSPAEFWLPPRWKQLLPTLPSKSCFSFLLSVSKIQFFSYARPTQVHRSSSIPLCTSFCLLRSLTAMTYCTNRCQGKRKHEQEQHHSRADTADKDVSRTRAVQPKENTSKAEHNTHLTQTLQNMVQHKGHKDEYLHFLETTADRKRFMQH